MCDTDGESVAVGFFDGVHLGHQAILHGATRALTFRNHPLTVLCPDRAPKLIMTCEERMAAIRACGVRDVEALEFTADLARETPESFLPRLGTHVRCGENWRFGAGGKGDAAFLRARGITVDVVPYAEYRGERISSTRIRTALEEGKIRDANAMLGRAFSIIGTIFTGKGTGGVIGYPTLNIAPSRETCIPRGVYAVSLGGKPAIANYGVAPTMGERAWTNPCLEVHVLAADGVTFAKDASVSVELHDFIRPERTFDSVEALSRQIAEDVGKITAGR